MPREQASAFAPGRVNLIGEHTDYNQGLALPFTIAEGVTVHATASGDRCIYTSALDYDEVDAFALDALANGGLTPGRLAVGELASDERTPNARALAESSRVLGWRAFVRGVASELCRAGYPLIGARLEIGGDVPRGAGLSSSAALEVALSLTLLALIDVTDSDRVGIARLCSKAENTWVGAHTGLLDQLATLYGAPATALRIDFRSLELESVPLNLKDGWRFVTVDSGEHHTNASSGYNERRDECIEACHLLGVDSLRQARWETVERLPERLRDRARHVLGENIRVQNTVDALRAGDLSAVGSLMNASHASLRDLYEVSTAAVEATVDRLLNAGAAGARIVGGGFGGHVLGLLGPDACTPIDAREVCTGPGAHLLHR